MQFNPEKLKRDVKHREKEVKVNELKAMYDLTEAEKNEDLFITCQGIGLGGLMAARDESAQLQMKALKALEVALSTQNVSEISDTIADIKHLSKEAKYHFFIVVAGCPSLQESDVAHIAEFYPAIVFRLSNEIQNLTNLGPEAKKN